MREVTSCVSGDHLLRIRRSPPAHRKILLRQHKACNEGAVVCPEVKGEQQQNKAQDNGGPRRQPLQEESDGERKDEEPVGSHDVDLVEAKAQDER